MPVVEQAWQFRNQRQPRNISRIVLRAIMSFHLSTYLFELPSTFDTRRRFVTVDALGVERRVTLVRAGEALWFARGRPERRHPEISSLQGGGPGSGVRLLEEHTRHLLACGARQLADAEPWSPEQFGAQCLRGVDPGAERDALKAVRSKKASKWGMRDALRRAALDDWDLLLWTFVRTHRVSIKKLSTLWLLGDAAREADPEATIWALSAIPSLGALYAAERTRLGLPGFVDLATDALLWEAYINDPKLVESAGATLAPEMRAGLAFIRLRADGALDEAEVPFLRELLTHNAQFLSAQQLGLRDGRIQQFSLDDLRQRLEHRGGEK